MLQHATSLKQVNKAIAAKYPHIFLVKGEGYYYIASDDKETGLMLAGLYTTSIPVFSIKHQTVEQWVEDVRNLVDNPSAFVY